MTNSPSLDPHWKSGSGPAGPFPRHRELTRSQRRLLQDVYDRFLDEGEWPPVRPLRIAYAEDPAGFEGLVQELGHELVVADDVRSTGGTCRLRLEALFYCRGAERDLRDAARLIRDLASLYEAGAEQASMARLEQQFAWSREALRRMARVLRHEAMVSMGGTDRDGNPLDINLDHDLVYLKGVESVEEYYARLNAHRERRLASSDRADNVVHTVSDRVPGWPSWEHQGRVNPVINRVDGDDAEATAYAGDVHGTPSVVVLPVASEEVVRAVRHAFKTLGDERVEIHQYDASSSPEEVAYRFRSYEGARALCVWNRADGDTSTEYAVRLAEMLREHAIRADVVGVAFDADGIARLASEALTLDGLERYREAMSAELRRALVHAAVMAEKLGEPRIDILIVAISLLQYVPGPLREQLIQVEGTATDLIEAARRADEFGGEVLQWQEDLVRDGASISFEQVQFARFGHEALNGLRAGIAAAVAVGAPRIGVVDLLRPTFVAESLRRRLATTAFPDVLPIIDAWREMERAAVGGLGSLLGAVSDSVDSTDDQLNVEPYVAAFVRLIRERTTQLPLTIGVLGPWGSGKSFFLARVLERAAVAAAGMHETSVVAVRYNAWQYSAAEQVWPGLVRLIFDTYCKHRKDFRRRRAAGRIRSRLARMMQSHDPLFVTAAALAIGALGTFTALLYTALGPGVASLFLGVGSVSAFAASWKRFGRLGERGGNWVVELFRDADYGRHLGHMADIGEDMGHLSSALGEDERILVVIDDLDRCEPHKAVEMLQAINLLLSFKGIVVCLGIDPRIVVAAVERHYSALLGDAGASGWEYLDKIVQIPFHIPTPGARDVEHFVFAQLGVPDSAVIRQAQSALHIARSPAEPTPHLSVGKLAVLGEKAEEYVHPRMPVGADGTTSAEGTPATQSSDTARSAQALDGAGETRVPEHTAPSRASDAGISAAFSPEEQAAFMRFSEYLPRNPRQLKRLLNVYRIVRELARSATAPATLLNTAFLVQWVIAATVWPKRMGLLVNLIRRQDRYSAASRRDIVIMAVSGLEADAGGDPVMEWERPFFRLMRSDVGTLTDVDLVALRRFGRSFLGLVAPNSPYA